MTDPVANIRYRFTPLLAEAEGALQRREQQYPALVKAGKIAANVAEREIRTWSAIVADWRRVVSGTGPRGEGASRAEKIEALEESIRRFNGQLAKVIAAAPVRVQRDCVEGAKLWMLEDRHGDAVEPVLEVHRQRERVEELRDWYRSEQSARGKLYAGIDDYLEFHRQLREANGSAKGQAAA